MTFIILENGPTFLGIPFLVYVGLFLLAILFIFKSSIQSFMKVGPYRAGRDKSTLESMIDERRKSRVIELKCLPEYWNVSTISAERDVPLMINFFSREYPPCKNINSAFEKFSKDFPSGIFCSADGDGFKALCEECVVAGVPTIQSYRGKKKVGQVIGGMTDELESLVTFSFSKQTKQKSTNEMKHKSKMKSS
uniref:Thioredoxin domain-containing protein n=1 Tax=Fibrocapsa japonica TaxID=94617 RepID=A0A7S2XW53_9STRA|mmetsp:Transcript_1493/g.2069  ORF Transcript_1493/g.2069 Transcript_1493/m.2069 type:complete len:193 (+) Transcript_1493:107-685(+)